MLENFNQYATISNSTRIGGVIVYFEKRWKVEKIAEKIIESIFNKFDFFLNMPNTGN